MMTSTTRFGAQERLPLRVGVIGLGIAGGLMMPAIAQHPRAVVAGAADRNPDLRGRFCRDFGIEAVDDGRALIDSSGIDAVYIATPHQSHRALAIAAAQSGKHIVLEKPMALSLEDCDAIIDAVERAGVAMVVGHTHSFDLPVRRIREHAQGGALGRLGLLSLWNYTDFLYRPRRPEELDTLLGGGILFNQLPHQVDIACLVAGSPVASVSAHTQVLDPSRPTEGLCAALLRFANGGAASLVYSGYDHFDSDELHGWVNGLGRRKQPAHGTARRALRALGAPSEETSLRASSYGYGAQRYAGTSVGQPHFGLIVASFEHGDVRVTPDGIALYADDGVQIETLPTGSTGRAEVLDELCSAVFEGRPISHDGRFARHTLAVCLAIQEAARTQSEVAIAS
jgi:phthalate 4,5-cis-dihydrodiol dehydrogenase